jgi:PIN domain nuclease of toxin-antitoxin system
MRLLLDTVTFLWIVEGSERLSDVARETFRNPDHPVFLSVVSAWEIAVKHELGRLPLPERPERFVPRMRSEHLIEPLALEESAALQLPKLPRHHRDPFDRMLVCQAIDGGMTILTPDESIRQYPVSTVW